jgi:4-amino-4-deoxy-L-arabinose transferase-like glycosyltransferase
MTARRFWSWLVALALVGLALRFAWVLGGNWSPTRLVGDAGYYHPLANLIADGHGFVDPEHPSRPTGLHPPLHPLMLAGASGLGLDTWTAHRLVTAATGAALVVLVGLLGRRVGGDRVGLVAASLAAVYPIFLRVDGAVLSESLYGCLTAACLLAAYRLLDRPGPRPALLLGALVGLATLTRPEALLLLVLLALPVVWRGGGRRLLHAGLACVAVLCVLSPWLVRNMSAFDGALLISNNSGTATAGANCDQTYSGVDLGLWGFACLRPVRRPGESEAEHAARLREQATDYAGDHLGRLPLVLAVRALRTWDLYQPLRQAHFSEGTHIQLYRLGLTGYYAVAVLAVWGLILLRRRGQPLLILLAPALLVTVSSLLAFGLPRFRHAAEVPLLVLAAVALTRAAELLRRRSARREGPVAA